MSLASVTAQQNALAAADRAAAGLATTAATPSAAGAKASALGSLSGNFSSFLSLLMTQLKNQDPTSPLDTNQFTSQLVQYSQVEQQINTNSSLTQLIQLTQGGELLQSSSMLGHAVSVASDHIPLQNGEASLQFTAADAGPVGVAVYSDAGVRLAGVTVQAAKGANTWTWNGQDAAGNQVADGSYRVAVYGADASGNAVAVPFAVNGTVTGVTSSGSSLDLQLGAQTAGFSTIRSVAGAG